MLFRLVPEWRHRFVDKFIEQLPTGEHSGYYRAMAPAIDAWQQSPIFGIGPANFRHLCPELFDDPTGRFCQPHPHNYYLQLLAETGIVGLILGIAFVVSIIWCCYAPSKVNKNNIFAVVAWVIPLSLFWPLASTADFFGQWHNIFVWVAVSLALSSMNLKGCHDKYVKDTT